jgi:hypothetical protein
MSTIAKNEWVLRFSRRMRELLPEVSGDETTRLAIAEAAFLEAADMAPEKVVETVSLKSRLMRSERHRKTVCCVL